MTKGIFRSALKMALDGQYENIKSIPLMVTIVRSDLYQVSLINDAVFADVPEEARVRTEQLTGVKVRNGGVFADDITFPKVGSYDDPVKVEFVFWQDSGDEKTSPLFCYLGKCGETFGFGSSSEYLPLTTNGGDITLYWGSKPFVFLPDWGE